MKSPVILWEEELSDFETEDFTAGFIRFENGSGSPVESN